MRTQWFDAPRACLLIALAGVMAAVAAPVALARPRPPVVVEPPPPPPPMPDVGLGEYFINDAAVYETYVSQAAAISPGFTDARAVAGALRVGAAYEPGQLRRGAVSYAAVAALEDEAFVADVRRAGATPEARYAIIADIFHDPANAMRFNGARTAAGLAKAALEQTGLHLFNAGDQVRLAAYSIQHQPWSLTEVSDRDSRAMAVKQLSSASRRPSAEAHTDVDRRIGGDPYGPPAAALPPYSPLVVRAVALAALAAVGQAENADAAHLGWLTDDYYLDHCLAETKLMLYECLAVAKPNYEDVFCLGQHAMKDTGACLVKSAWSTVPIDIRPHDLAIPAAHIRKAGPPTHRRRRG